MCGVRGVWGCVHVWCVCMYMSVQSVKGGVVRLVRLTKTTGTPEVYSGPSSQLPKLSHWAMVEA